MLRDIVLLLAQPDHHLPPHQLTVTVIATAIVMSMGTAMAMRGMVMATAMNMVTDMVMEMSLELLVYSLSSKVLQEELYGLHLF